MRDIELGVHPHYRREAIIHDAVVTFLIVQDDFSGFGGRTQKNYIKLLMNEGSVDESSSELFYNGLSYKEVDKEGNIVTEVECDKRGRIIEQTNYLSHPS